MGRSEEYKDERRRGDKRPSYTTIVVALCIATPKKVGNAASRR